MVKTRTSVWIDPHILRELKLLGVMRNQPIGNVIEALLDFSKMGQYITDPDFQRRWTALLATAFANAGQRATFEGDPPEAGFAAGQGPNGDDLDA